MYSDSEARIRNRNPQCSRRNYSTEQENFGPSSHGINHNYAERSPTSIQLLEEICQFYRECDLDCSVCDDLIVTLAQHVRGTHIQYNDRGCRVTDSMKRKDYSGIRNYHSESERGTCPTSVQIYQPEYLSLVQSQRVDMGYKNYENAPNSTLPPFSIKMEDIYLNDREFESLDLRLAPPIETFHEPELQSHICNVCQTESPSISALISHLKFLHPETLVRVKIRTCGICQVTFTGKSEFRAHKKQFHRDFKCKKCARCFANRKSLEDHIISHIDNPQDHVMVGYTKRRKMKTKKKMVHTCKVCGDTFNGRSAKAKLKKHWRKLHPDPDLKCQECGFYCWSKELLSKHMCRENKNRRYTCELYTHKIRKSLLTAHTDLDLDKFGERSNGRKEFASHKRIDEPFYCEICDRSFISKIRLEEHLLKHKGNSNSNLFNANKTLNKGITLELNIE